ncbi:MAG TPA: type III pantothenate kinase [Gammaproteobacteria bacterium]|nr:type III pantothenate kinase [Gammaproteobacteria bacterium]
MILLVDIGNSRIKWAFWHRNQLQDMAATTYNRQEVRQCLDRNWHAFNRPQQVNVSCVADATVIDALTAWTGEHWQLQPQFARVEKTAHGVTNSYEDHTRLGIDRWLAMIAVHRDRHTAACVIDCGTAITIDGLLANGQHMGGVIVPGLDLMRKSLYAMSPAVRAQNTDVKPVLCGLARSTEAAVMSGCRLAAAGAIEMVSRSLQEEFDGAVEFIITGGDAGVLMPELTCNPRHEPHLVLQGLAISAGVDA